MGFDFPRARLFGIRLFCVTTMVMVVLASVAVSPRPAAAQMEFDFNDDGTVTCVDFRDEFPNTFTDEATKALRQYPDELRDLNRDSEDDDIACEGQPAREPAPTATPAPAPPPEAPATSSAEASGVPADVMTRVEGCAVVAISPHDLVGAGCPGVGVVTYHVPDGAPLLKGTVMLNPGAAQAAEADRARESTTATGANGSTENANSEERAQERARGGNGKDRAPRKQSADDDTKASKGKGKKQDRDGKNKNKNKKGGKNKKGKKQRRH